MTATKPSRHLAAPRQSTWPPNWSMRSFWLRRISYSKPSGNRSLPNQSRPAYRVPTQRMEELMDNDIALRKAAVRVFSELTEMQNCEPGPVTDRRLQVCLKLLERMTRRLRESGQSQA